MLRGMVRLAGFVLARRQVLGFNKSTVQHIFRFKGSQVHKCAAG